LTNIFYNELNKRYSSWQRYFKSVYDWIYTLFFTIHE